MIGNETLGGGTGGSHDFALTVNSGGENDVNGTIMVNTGSQLTLSGGTITANGFNLSNTPARFNWTSGTLILNSSVTFDPDNPASFTGETFGHELFLTNGKTFNVIGDETLGFNEFFDLEVDTGGSHRVHGTLTVNPEGQLGIFGGTVNATSLNNIGPMYLDAGTVTADSVTLNSSGQLNYGLSSTTRGAGYGVLIANGHAALDGQLIVTLSNFTPSAGNSFDLLDWITASGSFNFISLPTLPSGLVWDTSQLYTSGILSVDLVGDYNHDGVVDAADYVVWRKGLGTTYTQNDYDVWRANFGQTAPGAGSGSGAIANAAVPEPATLILLMFAIAGSCLRRRRVA